MLVRVSSHVVRIIVDGGVYGFAPGVGAEGVYVFVLGELDGLDKGLAEIGQGGSGLGLDVALGDSSKEAAQGRAEIAGGDITAGEEIGDVAANLLGGPSLRFLAGMEVAEVGDDWNSAGCGNGGRRRR